MGLLETLSSIQQKLNAPKKQYNSFGKYNYRNCEDILEAVKPLLNGTVLVISDELINFGDRYYVKATASLKLDGEAIEATAFAREAESKKGMDEAQVTGSASSYARKYALNGLFLIDDSKDPDTRDNSNSKTPNPQPTQKFKERFTPVVISVDQHTEISDLIEQTNSDIDIFLEYFKIKKLDDLNALQYPKAKKMLQKKIEGGK